MASQEDRYARHRVIPEIGDLGQKKIKAASVLIVGCGALGSVQAQLLARAGIGRLRIVDPDLPELVNLQRQLLFDEADLGQGQAKADIAAHRLSRVNSEVKIEAQVARVDASNIEALMTDVDLVMDATDNFETRYVINDACVKHQKPWIYGGVIATTGMSMPVIPGSGPCLRCVFPDPPPPGASPTGLTAGILSSAPVAIAAIQCASALRLLVGDIPPQVALLTLELWQGSAREVQVSRDQACPCCGQARFEFL